jgi:hypothetical protein
MRYHHLSSPHTTPSTSCKAAPARGTIKNLNNLSQLNETDVGELESYIRRKADASMRRAMRSVWQGTFTDIDDIR